MERKSLLLSVVVAATTRVHKRRKKACNRIILEPVVVAEIQSCKVVGNIANDASIKSTSKDETNGDSELSTTMQDNATRPC